MYRVRHSRMLLAGIQREFRAGPRLKHSGVTPSGRPFVMNRSPKHCLSTHPATPQFSKEDTKNSKEDFAQRRKGGQGSQIPLFPPLRREGVKKLVLLNPTPKISPDPSFSKEGNSCSKQTWGRILNTKDCVSISGYFPL